MSGPKKTASVLMIPVAGLFAAMVFVAYWFLRITGSSKEDLGGRYGGMGIMLVAAGLSLLTVGGAVVLAVLALACGIPFDKSCLP